MILTYKTLILEELWTDWVKHATTYFETELGVPLPLRLVALHQVKEKPVLPPYVLNLGPGSSSARWGAPNLSVDLLLRRALRAESHPDAHFVLVSGASAPVKPFEDIYNEIMADPRSRFSVWATEFSGCFPKVSAWYSLSRKHVEALTTVNAAWKPNVWAGSHAPIDFPSPNPYQYYPQNERLAPKYRAHSPIERALLPDDRASNDIENKLPMAVQKMNLGKQEEAQEEVTATRSMAEESTQSVDASTHEVRSKLKLIPQGAAEDEMYTFAGLWVALAEPPAWREVLRKALALHRPAEWLRTAEVATSLTGSECNSGQIFPGSVQVTFQHPPDFRSQHMTFWYDLNERISRPNIGGGKTACAHPLEFHRVNPGFLRFLAAKTNVWFIRKFYEGAYVQNSPTCGLADTDERTFYQKWVGLSSEARPGDTWASRAVANVKSGRNNVTFENGECHTTPQAQTILNDPPADRCPIQKFLSNLLF